MARRSSLSLGTAISARSYLNTVTLLTPIIFPTSSRVSPAASRASFNRFASPCCKSVISLPQRFVSVILFTSLRITVVPIIYHQQTYQTTIIT
nr:MAG TPA: hypothetical protein [Caudoviricetes sp.]